MRRKLFRKPVTAINIALYSADHSKTLRGSSPVPSRAESQKRRQKLKFLTWRAPSQYFYFIIIIHRFIEHKGMIGDRTPRGLYMVRSSYSPGEKVIDFFILRHKL